MHWSVGHGSDNRRKWHWKDKRFITDRTATLYKADLEAAGRWRKLRRSGAGDAS
jgi:hypothetical protein